MGAVRHAEARAAFKNRPEICKVLTSDIEIDKSRATVTHHQSFTPLRGRLQSWVPTLAIPDNVPNTTAYLCATLSPRHVPMPAMSIDRWMIDQHVCPAMRVLLDHVIKMLQRDCLSFKHTTDRWHDRGAWPLLLVSQVNVSTVDKLTGKLLLGISITRWCSFSIRFCLSRMYLKLTKKKPWKRKRRKISFSRRPIKQHT